MPEGDRDAFHDDGIGIFACRLASKTLAREAIWHFPCRPEAVRSTDEVDAFACRARLKPLSRGALGILCPEGTKNGSTGRI